MRTLKITVTDADGVLLDRAEIDDPGTGRLAVVPVEPGMDNPRSVADLTIGTSDGTLDCHDPGDDGFSRLFDDLPIS